jgi:uncharacterized protein
MRLWTQASKDQRVTWWQWLLACLAAFLIGLSKTGIAGIGILSVALFANVLPVRESIGTALLTLIAGDIMAVTIYRRDASWPHLLRLFPPTAIGVVIGALALDRIPDLGLRRLIGAILLALVVLHVARIIRSRPPAEPAGSHRPWLIGWTGVAAGFTTMVANAAGPIMILYLLALRMPKLLFIGTSAWFFLVLNLFKVPFSINLGLITFASIAISLRLIPFAIVGALVGRRILQRIDQRLFERLALVLTLLAGLRLLW